jgi:hypothetical protein
MVRPSGNVCPAALVCFAHTAPCACTACDVFLCGAWGWLVAATMVWVAQRLPPVATTTTTTTHVDSFHPSGVMSLAGRLGTTTEARPRTATVVPHPGGRLRTAMAVPHPAGPLGIMVAGIVGSSGRRRGTLTGGMTGTGATGTATGSGATGTSGSGTVHPAGEAECGGFSGQGLPWLLCPYGRVWAVDLLEGVDLQECHAPAEAASIPWW